MLHHLPARAFYSLFGTASHLPISRISPRCLLSTAAPIPPQPFAVEDYLVANCGLTQAQALKASSKLSKVKSPSNPDAVLAFLSGLGLPRSDIATFVAADPRVLCASVETTLDPRVSELRKLGLSSANIARLPLLVQRSFRSRILGRNLSFWLSVFGGSFEKLEKAMRMNNSILRVGIEKVAMPNIAFLEQCGLNVFDVANLDMYSGRLLILKPESLREAVERVEELGVERGSRMFRRALRIVALLSKEDVARKMKLLHTIGFSEDEALQIVHKAPNILRLSDAKIRRAGDFLMRDVGLDTPYIARRPVLLLYSLERRLLPRHFVLKVLREKGLLSAEFGYYTTASMAEKIFVQRFVHPYKDHVPGLADDYASKCSGKALDGTALLEV